MVGETRPASKMFVTLVAGDANIGERARRVRDTIAKRLIKDVCYIAATTFMTCTTYEPFRHCTCKISYHVIIRFDIVVEYVDTFGSVDLTFEHYIVTPKSLINFYVIGPKVFLKRLSSGIPYR